MSETNLIGIYYIASIVKIKKGIIAIGYKEGEVEVINVDDYDYPVLLGRFQCIYKNDIFSILSMAYITEGLISIETGTCVIEIWRIFDLDDNIIEIVRHPRQVVKIKIDDTLYIDDMIRLKYNNIDKT